MNIRQLGLLALAVLLIGCQSVPLLSSAVQEPAPSAIKEAVVPPLVGRVDFPEGLKTQATSAQLLSQATVALIDNGTTVTSGVTDAAGNFTLNFGAFNPVADRTYILEASKGLVAQLPGYEAPRFRTIVQYKATGTGAPGWLSITNSSLPGTPVIDSWTTAVAIESGLDPTNVPPANTIGKVIAGTGLNPAWVNPATNTNEFASHSNAEIIGLRADVNAYLTANIDPIRTTNAIKPAVSLVAPTAGDAYTLVTVTGTGFSPVSGGTSVTIGGTACPVLMASSTQLILQVPVGATSGNLVVSTTRGGASNATAFSVPNGSAVVVSGLAPNPVKARGTVTLTGRGFSTTPANNGVSFGGVAGTVTAASPTSLVVSLPAAATSGNVTVTVGGQTSNSYFLTVEPLTRISEIFPNKAARGNQFYIYGENFGGLPGIVTVGGEKAVVKYWRNNWIQVLVPFEAANGAAIPVQVTTADNKTVASTMQVLLGEVGGFVNIGTLPSNSGNSPGPAWTHKNLYIAGGGNGANVARLPLNDVSKDGAINVGAIQGSIGTMPFGMGTNDIGKHWFGFTHPTKWWFAGNNVANKGYLAFNEATGDYLGAYDAGPVNYGPAVGDSGLHATEKAVYIFTGGDTGGSATTFAYAMVNQADGTFGPWTNYNNLAGYPSGDAVALIVGSNLWLWAVNVQRAIPVNPDGSISNVAWTDYGVPFASGIYPVNMAQVGDYVYNWGQWSSGANIYRATLQRGITLTGAWSDYTNTTGVVFPGLGATIVIGGYVYIIGGYGSNVIYQAPITN